MNMISESVLFLKRLRHSVGSLIQAILLVHKHEGAFKLTDVTSCLDPSSSRLVSGSLEQEGGR